MFFVFLGLAIADALFLGFWLYSGFQVNGDPDLAQRHQIGGLLVCILTCFVHAVTFVYFLGTGLAVKEARKNWGISLDYVRHTRAYKLKAYPVAMIAIAFTIAAGILGGAVRSGDSSPMVHRSLALLAMGVSFLAFAIALRYILRNGYMMGLIRQDIAEIRQRQRAGQDTPRLKDGDVPELLKNPEEVKKAPGGFLLARALFFLGINAWLLYAYLQWFLRVEWVSWVPFTVLSAALLTFAVFLHIRHPLPAEVDF